MQGNIKRLNQTSKENINYKQLAEFLKYLKNMNENNITKLLSMKNSSKTIKRSSSKRKSLHSLFKNNKKSARSRSPSKKR